MPNGLTGPGGKHLSPRRLRIGGAAGQDHAYFRRIRRFRPGVEEDDPARCWAGGLAYLRAIIHA